MTGCPPTAGGPGDVAGVVDVSRVVAADLVLGSHVFPLFSAACLGWQNSSLAGARRSGDTCR